MVKGDIGLGSVDNTADIAKTVLSATKLTTARTIGLSGDVSGSVSFDGSANATITATIADDSHNHIIGNVDGLQGALDLKANQSTTYTKTETDSAIANLVDSSPTALDTLNELAAALGDDPNFATTVATSIGTKQATLVSGTNIKTVNSTSLLGSGNLAIESLGVPYDNSTSGLTATNVQAAVDELQDEKQAVITGAATTIDTENLTASRALVSDGSGKVAVSDVTATELGYVDGVTSAIQTQLNAKVDEVSSTDNAIVRFNGTGGSVQNSGVTVDDSNNIITPSIIGTSSTGSLRMPVGTSAQRDGSPATGMIRHNTQYGCPEYYNGFFWVQMNGTFWEQMNAGAPNIGDPFGGGSLPDTSLRQRTALLPIC